MQNVTEEEHYLQGGSCPVWLEAQNPLFHVSMLMFAGAFIVPYSFKYYVIGSRVFLTAALCFLMLWGALYWCTFDVLIWGAVFLIQTLSQLLYSLYKRRRIRFPEELEDIYVEIFEAFNVSRYEFKALVNQNCKWVNIFPGDKYAVENHTTVEARLSLLVAGCLRVTYKGIYLHDVKEKQLIDSVEWESTKMKRGELFQVTVEAIDRCFYLCWNREKLQYYLQANPNLQKAFQYIRGRDIMEKVYQTSLNASRRLQNESGCSDEKPVNAIDIRKGLASENPSAIYQ